MFKVNEYFDGKVTSIAFESSSLPATVGVMAPGNYTFETDCKEIMTVVSGGLTVKLPNTNDWQAFSEGQVFEVEKDQQFDLKVKSDTAYLCQYIRD